MLSSSGEVEEDTNRFSGIMGNNERLAYRSSQPTAKSNGSLQNTFSANVSCTNAGPCTFAFRVCGQFRTAENFKFFARRSTVPDSQDSHGLIGGW